MSQVPATTDAISGFIQAGGRSSRMGQDKAWLPLGAHRTIDFVLAALRPVVAEVAVIAHRPEYRQLGLPVYADLLAERGPLSGIHAALTHATGAWVLAVACDLPFVTPELLRLLVAARQDCQIVVPLNQEAQPEPLCALYHKDCLPLIERNLQHPLQEGRRAPRLLFEQVPTRYLAWSELAHLPGAAHFFMNLNTPADYQRALAIYAEHYSAQAGELKH